MLSLNRINEIEGRAQDVLLTAYADETAFVPPIDVAKIAKTLGLTLKEGIFADENVVGAYDKSLKTIFIEERDPYARKAFTVAHEIGHFILHQDKEKEVFLRSDALLLDRQEKEVEYEANCFAAGLLMPKGTLIRYFKVTKNVHELAEIFGVTVSAMSWRLKNLSLAGG